MKVVLLFKESYGNPKIPPPNVMQIERKEIKSVSNDQFRIKERFPTVQAVHKPEKELIKKSSS